jgi:hypothetical protein
MNLSPFEKKCLALNIGYGHDVCDGKYCEKRMTCVRYMLHKKAVLEEYNNPLWYVGRKFRFEECYKKYEQDSN